MTSSSPSSTPTKYVLLFVLGIIALPLRSGAVDADRPGLGERKAARGPYVYPILPGTPEWAALDSHAAMVEATLVPQERLDDMRTAGLVKTVLTYPMFWDAFLYDNIQQGMDAVASQSNAIAELYRRKDAGKVLIERYRAMSIPPTTLSDGEAMRLTTDFTLIESLLAQRPILTSLTRDESELLLNEAVRVATEKAAHPDVFSAFGLERSALVAGRILYADSAVNDAVIDQFLRDGSMLATQSLAAVLERAAARVRRSDVRVDGIVQSQDYESDKLVKTPRGVKVPVIVVTEELTSREKRKAEEYVMDNYPQAVAETGATRRYNCHSYAWHSQSSTNTYAINTPNDDLYWAGSNKSYVSITSGAAETGIPKNVPNNAKVGYPESRNHSAIKISNTEFRSKWGHGPRVRHKPAYAPYVCTSKRCTTSLIYYRLR